jgi:hypothetical protein
MSVVGLGIGWAEDYTGGAEKGREVGKEVEGIHLCEEWA